MTYKTTTSFFFRHFLVLFGVALLLLMFIRYFIDMNGVNGLANLNDINLGRIDKSIILVGLLSIIVYLIPENVMISIDKNRIYFLTNLFADRYAKITICLLIIFGFYLRVVNLGNISFMYDELTTTFAAIGILKHGTPIMEYFGDTYTRSILNTRLIALSLGVFGVNEFGARFISVLFGTLTIPLVYLTGNKLANKRAAILAALIITFSGWEILWSREARMYAQFQFFYLLLAYIFYLGLNDTNKYRKIFFLLLSPIIFVCGIQSHRLIFTFLPVAFTYVLISRKEVITRYAKYSILILPIVLYMIISKISLDYLRGYLVLHTAPIWGQYPFYYYVVFSDLNILFSLVFISIIVSTILWKLQLITVKDKTVYLLLSFFIPLVILSFYPWKISRYSFFTFPLLAILAAQAFDFFVIRGSITTNTCSNIAKRFSFQKESLCYIKHIFISMLVILLTAQLMLVVVHDPSDSVHHNWKKAGEYLNMHLVEGDKIATTSPAHGFYYLGGVDYDVVQYDDYGKPLTSSYRSYGTTRLNNYSFFVETIEDTRGWMVIDNVINTHKTDPRVKMYIENNMTYHPEGSENTLKVYSWNNTR